MVVGSERFALWLEVERPEPIAGWIGDDADERVRFDGWLELISQLQRLLAPGHPGRRGERG
ncbi:MAG: hypothetical protein ACRDMJ_17050 [Solirubrobacteraceae bacterium]